MSTLTLQINSLEALERLMKDHVTPEHTCASCGYTMDRALNADNCDLPPQENDITICPRCAEALIFNADLTVRAATLNDLVDCPEDIQRTIGETQRAIRSLPKRNETKS